jgi:acetyl-CoA C-acetyltransferase
MVDRLRHDPGALGLVTGVGMHMTKHSAVVYSTTPDAIVPTGAAAPEAATVDIVDAHHGTARVAAYSVVHGRSGAPEWGLLVCDVAAGARCYARTDDADLLAALEREEWVGRSVRLSAEPGTAGTVNRVVAPTHG